MYTSVMLYLSPPPTTTSCVSNERYIFQSIIHTYLLKYTSIDHDVPSHVQMECVRIQRQIYNPEKKQHITLYQDSRVLGKIKLHFSLHHFFFCINFRSQKVSFIHPLHSHYIPPTTVKKKTQILNMERGSSTTKH